jgi:hypothetical protein
MEEFHAGIVPCSHVPREVEDFHIPHGNAEYESSMQLFSKAACRCKSTSLEVMTWIRVTS